MTQYTDAAYESSAAQEVRGSNSSSSLKTSIRWTSLSQIVRVLLQFLAQLFLAHLLSPADFGIAAMAFVVSGFAGVLAESGIQAAVVQRRKLDQPTLSAAFAINVALSLIIATVVIGIAPLAASFYRHPQVSGVLYLTAPALIITGLFGVHRGLLERRMNFKAIAFIETTAALGGAAVCIGAAAAGAGVYSLPLNALAVALIAAIGNGTAARWMPTVWPTRSSFAGLGSFSSNLLGFNAINYWARNLDNLLVARYLGANEAGYYTRAYAFLLLPVTQVSAVLGRVMLPSFSSIQDDHQKIAAAYLRAVATIAAITWLPLTLLALTSDRIIPLLLGHEWRPASSIVSVFALLGIIQVIATTVGWLFLSQGATRLMFYWGGINAVLYIAAFIFGVILGSGLWVATLFGISVCITWPLTTKSACALVGLSTSRVFEALARPFISCLASASVASLGFIFVQHEAASLVYQFTSACITFVAIGTWLKLAPVRFALRYLASILGRR